MIALITQSVDVAGLAEEKELLRAGRGVFESSCHQALQGVSKCLDKEADLKMAKDMS